VITEREQREARIALRLWKMGKGDVLRGVTSGDQVKQRIRKTIIEHELGARIFGVASDGTKVIFAEAFQATYGEPLTLKGDQHGKNSVAA
jgi:hypothetical protein